MSDDDGWKTLLMMFGAMAGYLVLIGSFAAAGVVLSDWYWSK